MKKSGFQTNSCDYSFLQDVKPPLFLFFVHSVLLSRPISTQIYDDRRVRICNSSEQWGQIYQNPRNQKPRKKRLIARERKTKTETSREREAKKKKGQIFFRGFGVVGSVG